MDELITRHLMGEATPAEERELRNWRLADPANEARYQRRVRLWALLGRVEAPAARRAPAARELIERAGVRRLFVADPARAGVWGGAGARRGWWRTAAGGVLAAAALAALLVGVRAEPEPSFGAVEFIAGPHRSHTLRLDDGTVVRLAPGSRIAFDGRSPGERRVTFEGVGYFAVARDPARPFVIRTEGGDARVLGTRFELRTERDEMRVVVVEGRVALESEGQAREVNANQLGRAGADQPPTVVDVEDVGELLGWVEGLLVFQATPLREVAAELSAHYGVPIEILDDALARREVTAWLREQSFHSALTAVCGAVSATCTIHRDRATMDLPP